MLVAADASTKPGPRSRWHPPSSLAPTPHSSLLTPGCWHNPSALAGWQSGRLCHVLAAPRFLQRWFANRCGIQAVSATGLTLGPLASGCPTARRAWPLRHLRPGVGEPSSTSDSGTLGPHLACVITCSSSKSLPKAVPQTNTHAHPLQRPIVFGESFFGCQQIDGHSSTPAPDGSA